MHCHLAAIGIWYAFVCKTFVQRLSHLVQMGDKQHYNMMEKLPTIFPLPDSKGTDWLAFINSTGKHWVESNT
jgi:predicted DNA-binding transcriptional regulator AlpA